MTRRRGRGIAPIGKRCPTHHRVGLRLHWTRFRSDPTWYSTVRLVGRKTKPRCTGLFSLFSGYIVSIRFRYKYRRLVFPNQIYLFLHRRVGGLSDRIGIGVRSLTRRYPHEWKYTVVRIKSYPAVYIGTYYVARTEFNYEDLWSYNWLENKLKHEQWTTAHVSCTI